MKDRFDALDSTKLLWGLSKFHNRQLNPYFNNDPASILLNRASLCPVRSVTHRIPILVVEEILKNNEKQTLENLCIGLYSLASMDFYHQEYFEQVFITLQEQNMVPHID